MHGAPQMPSLNLNSIVVRGSRHVETEVAGQVFMMSLEEGKYFALDASARRIWQLIAQPMSLRSIVSALTDEYDVEPARCEAEVLGFVESLLSRGLIVTEPS